MKLQSSAIIIILLCYTAATVSCNSKLKFLSNGRINGKVKKIVQTSFICEFTEGELKISNPNEGRDNYESQYNKLGKITTKIYHEPNKLNLSRYYYNQQNKKSRYETLNRNDSIFWSEIFTYNSQNLLIDHNIINDKYGSHTTFKYFNNQKLKSKTKKDRLHNRITYSSYEYYDTGELKEVKEQNELKKIKRKINYQYYPDSQFKTVTISYPNSQRDSNIFKYHIKNKQFVEEDINKGYSITRTYNLNGDIMGYQINNRNGSRSTRYTYVYDKKNNWTEKIEYRWSGDITMYRRLVEYY